MVEQKLAVHSSGKEEKRVYLIDASIYIFRYYFSMPDRWFSKSGYPTATVYGYAYWLIRFLKAVNPKHVAACFDESLESCFRNELYPDYKSSRLLPDENLAFQLEACKQITELLGVPSYASDRYEADDLIGTLAQRSADKNLPFTVLSRDKDLGQLVWGESDTLWDYPEGVDMGPSEIFAKTGIYPHQVADYLALVGDTSDDIPGVPGVGAKTAAALLSELQSWENIKQDYKQVADLTIRGSRSLSVKLEEYEEQIELAKKLATIVTDAPLKKRFSINRKKIDMKALDVFVNGLGFQKGFMTSVESL